MTGDDYGRLVALALAWLAGWVIGRSERTNKKEKPSWICSMNDCGIQFECDDSASLKRVVLIHMESHREEAKK